ncbi:hypothetical protein ABRY23_11505 [Melioribacteraceae bacterium 4301-Me]|uniref:hypothetical protein n=1 Tax=Pyranulibacter aquaticus TaxID=3163344 RepID=UPI00359A13F6
MIEIVGYLASVLVAISLMMSSILKLRIINLIGAITFTIYGFIINAFPVAAVNFFISIVDIYYLWEIFSRKEYFKVLKVEADAEYLKNFLTFYENDIKKYIPSFKFYETKENIAFFVLRNMIPAGLVIARKISNDTILVDLDYVIPGYRDFKIGKFVYTKIFSDMNVKEIVSLPGNKTHIKYLKRMGFSKKVIDGKTIYALTIH